MTDSINHKRSVFAYLIISSAVVSSLVSTHQQHRYSKKEGLEFISRMDNLLERTINLPLSQLSALSISLAVASHFVLFSRPELDSWFRIFFCSLFVSPVTLFFIFYSYCKRSFAISLLLMITIYWSFLLGLTASILVYRIWLHPLRNMPGPFWAKTSNWWVVYQQWRTGLRFHQYSQELHKRYGDILRIGVLKPRPILACSHPGPESI